MRGLFVTGTDTGVGKTIVSASLVAAMRAAGERPAAYKPVVTGLDELGDPGSDRWPADHELLARAADMDAAVVSPRSFGPAVSPHLAAELSGEALTAAELLEGARAAESAVGERTALIVEGVGGLLVPLSAQWQVCDLAGALDLPVVIAARPGLGTINHSLLTVEAARRRGLDVRAVVLTPWPSAPGVLERSNRATIERIAELEVATLPVVSGPEVDELARAGAALPWRRWLDGTATAPAAMAPDAG